MDPHRKKFIDSCVSTFEIMEHNVDPGKAESAWHFNSTNHRGDRHYAVYCTPSIDSCKALIQASIRQAKDIDARFVVVVLSMRDSDLAHSEKLDYCLVTLDEITRYGDEMLEIRGRDAGHGRVILRH